MSYKVEITAGSVAELAGKLLALAATMQAQQHDPVMPEVKAAEAPKPSRAKQATEAAKEPAGEPASTAEAPSPISNSEPVTPIAETAPPPSEPEPAAAPTLDFDKDVAPVVLGAVKTKGREWVQGILSQFGAERASQVPEEQFGELVAALQDGGE